jgi:hypothetical protein
MSDIFGLSAGNPTQLAALARSVGQQIANPGGGTSAANPSAQVLTGVVQAVTGGPNPGWVQVKLIEDPTSTSPTADEPWLPTLTRVAINDTVLIESIGPSLFIFARAGFDLSVYNVAGIGSGVPLYTNGWGPGLASPPRVYFDETDHVNIAGQIVPGSAGTTQAFSLPTMFRPANVNNFVVITSAGPALATVTTTGVQLTNPGGGSPWVSLNGIRYSKAAGA